jgi:hypothetical protein
MRTILTGVALALAATAAAADELPRAYLGAWCGVLPTEEKQEVLLERPGKYCDAGGLLSFSRNGMDFEGENTCRFTMIRQGDGWAPHTKARKSELIPEVFVRAACGGFWLTLWMHWVKGSGISITVLQRVDRG